MVAILCLYVVSVLGLSMFIIEHFNLPEQLIPLMFCVGVHLPLIIIGLFFDKTEQSQASFRKSH